MNRSIRFLIATGCLSAITAGLVPGCADNNSTLFIIGVLKPQSPPTCTVLADLTQPMLLSGVLDVAIRYSYEAVLLVGNQFTPRGQKQNLKIETTRVNLRGAEITLSDSAGNTVDSFSVGGSGFVDTNNGDAPGLGLFAADLIPASVGEKLKSRYPALGTLGGSTTLYSNTRVFGDSLGNTSVTSGALSYPIVVCNGCLVSFPVDAIDTSQNNACVKDVISTPTAPCLVGQDDPVDCRLCSTESVTCLCGGDAACQAANGGGP